MRESGRAGEAGLFVLHLSEAAGHSCGDTQWVYCSRRFQQIPGCAFRQPVAASRNRSTCEEPGVRQSIRRCRRPDCCPRMRQPEWEVMYLRYREPVWETGEPAGQRHGSAEGPSRCFPSSSSGIGRSSWRRCSAPRPRARRCPQLNCTGSSFTRFVKLLSSPIFSTSSTAIAAA